MSEDAKKKEEEDLISSAIGNFGKWQLCLTFALSLVNIPCTWHIFVPTFHSASKDTWCARSSFYEKIPLELWKNCTGQSQDFCSMYDVASKNLSGSDLCSSANNFDRVKCSSWEYGGEGELNIKLFFPIISLE